MHPLSAWNRNYNKTDGRVKMSEDDFAVEPIEGLPELLPKGEVILWQGRPNWWRLTVESLNLWWVIGYFGLLAAWRFLTVIDYMPLGTSLSLSIPFLFVGGFVGLLLCIVGYIQAKATLYTITNRRVAMRIGAALTVTLNLPFTQIDNAAVAKKSGGFGNIALETAGRTKFSYFVLWPHARAWYFRKPQPTFRCIPDIEEVSSILGQAATEDTVAAFRAELGLDKPSYIRYFDWIGAVAQGDLGYSFSGRSASGIDRSRAVVDLVAPRLGNTLFLAGMAAIVSVPLALVLGITAALYRNSFYDRSVNAVTLTTISFPEFFLAYLLILFLASLWPVFPSLANVNAETELIDRIYKCVLPALTLTLVIVAHMMRMTRAAIINLLASPYIEMSQLKGLSKAKVIMRHALPNAWAPIATVIAFNLAYLVVGVVVVEVVFVYPGIGQLMVDAVTTRDIPVVQACALIFATTYILLNLTADIIGIVTNPRLLHPR